MAYNFNEIEKAKSGLDGAQNDMEQTLKSFSDIIESNVTNTDVWKGKSADEFKKRWNDFQEAFAKYNETFRKQTETAHESIVAYEEAENK